LKKYYRSLLFGLGATAFYPLVVLLLRQLKSILKISH